jgi:hypothetical protein
MARAAGRTLRAAAVPGTIANGLPSRTLRLALAPPAGLG